MDRREESQDDGSSGGMRFWIWGTGERPCRATGGGGWGREHHNSENWFTATVLAARHRTSSTSTGTAAAALQARHALDKDTFVGRVLKSWV